MRMRSRLTDGVTPDGWGGAGAGGIGAQSDAWGSTYRVSPLSGGLLSRRRSASGYTCGIGPGATQLQGYACRRAEQDR